MATGIDYEADATPPPRRRVIRAPCALAAVTSGTCALLWQTLLKQVTSPVRNTQPRLSLSSAPRSGQPTDRGEARELQLRAGPLVGAGMRVIIHVMMLVHFLQKFGSRVNYHPDHHHLTSQNRTHSSQESGSCVRGGVQATGAGSEVGEPGQQYSPLLNCSWCPGAAGTCDNRVVFFVTSTARLLSR